MRSNLAKLILIASITGITTATAGPASAAVSPVRVDTGSTKSVTSGGVSWAADKGFSGGTKGSTTATIYSTNASTVSRSYRYGMSAYTLPVPNGTYDVRLHMLEPYWKAAGKRVFDVTLEGSTVLDNLDIYKKTGGRNRVFEPLFRTTVKDGQLSLGFKASRDKSLVAGIEVLPVATTTTSPTTSPTTETTAPAPTTETTAPASTKLRWAPPALSNPTTIQATNSRANISLEAGRDYVVELPSTPLTAKGGLQISGGRNVVVIGGEIRAPRASVATASQRRGMLLRGQTGTVHVEGVHITGEDLAEGIQLDQRLGAVVQLQNIRVETVHGTQAGNHADVLQTWAGPRKLLVDGLTGFTGYQGMMLNPNDGAFGGADRPRPERFDFHRVDLTGNTDSVYMVWLSKGTAAVDELAVSDFWIQANPSRVSRDSYIWPKPSTGDTSWTAAKSGSPVAPFVPATSTGIGYVSPGYVG